jgi:hypothetical protein
MSSWLLTVAGCQCSHAWPKRLRQPATGYRQLLIILVVLLTLTACRTGRPAGAPVAPLTAATSDEAITQLRARRAEFRGMRSLMRVRATRNGQTQSFRAQLVVHDARRMELIAYTPVGTTAMTMKADGDRVTTDPAVPPGSFDFLRASGLVPAEVGMLILGLPPRDDLQIEVAPAGISAATSEGITVTFDPPAFPAKHVIVTRGSERIEIEHLETTQ